jgi:hypothetical protein
VFFLGNSVTKSCAADQAQISYVHMHFSLPELKSRGKLALNSKTHNIVKALLNDKHAKNTRLITVVIEYYGLCLQNGCIKKNELLQIRLSRNLRTTKEDENAAETRHLGIV